MVNIYMSKNNILLISSISILVSCGGGGGGSSISNNGSDGYGSGSSNSAPIITNTSLNISVVENQTSAFTVTASDSDNDSLTYTILNNDAGLFTISSSGVVSFSTAPDFESPSDANEDNVYSLSASVSDGTLSDSKDFTVTVTNDESDDEVASAWDGVLLKDTSYAPYDKHATSYALILAGLPDVTDEFVINVANIANRILALNSSTNTTNRNALLNGFITNKAFQRIGKTGMNSYSPSLNEANYPGWDDINDTYDVVDFIWESTSDSVNQTKESQINAILEHLIHTITLGYDRVFNNWSYDDQNSELNLAMQQAVDMGHYDTTGMYTDVDDATKKRILAQEFAYWMILTGWDLKASYAPDASPEWNILTAAEMQTKLPLAHTLFTDTVNGVLVNPTKDYLDGLTFSSITSQQQTESVQVSVAANNSGTGNVYVIDGTQKKSITLIVGTTYTFTHSSSHPFRFSTTSDGTHGGGNEYTSGVTKSSGSTIIEVTSSTPTTLYYYCSVHPGMGATATINN
jgi:plastocyanin